jgi:hypothetical protein
VAIARVEALAKHEGQPLLQDHGLVVEWRPDHPVDDDEYDNDYQPPNLLPIDDDAFSLDDYDPIDPNELDDLGATIGFPHALPAANPGAAPHQNDLNQNENEQNEQDEQNNENENEDEFFLEITDEEDGNEHLADEEGELLEAAAPPELGALPEEGNPPEEEVLPEEGAHIDEGALPDGAPEPGVSHPGYNLRERRVRTDRLRDTMDQPHDRQAYHAPVQLLQQGLDAQCKYIFEWIMTQMTARAGLKKHGPLAETALLLKEFSQQQDLDVWEILDPLELTFDQKQNALRALNLLKEKRNGDLKGRTVADSSKQKNMYPKSKTASPTVSTAALMLTILIDAYERRDAATADVAGAYLKATMNDYVLIKFVGESVDILLKMESSYAKFVTYEKGVKVLYARLKKALYGCVQSALLWYS